MKYLKKKVINIVVLILTINICSAFWGAYLDLKSEDEYDASGEYELVSARVEEIGKEYNDEVATDGYSFYRVVTKVRNISQYSETKNRICFNIVCEDNGTPCWQEYENYDNFDYYKIPLVPAGRATEIESVVRIPSDCSQITVSFSESTKGEGNLTISL